MVVPASVYRGVYGICDKEDPRDPIDLMDSDHCIHIGDPVPRIYIERTTIYAIGTNQESAQVAGIKQPRVVFLAMTLCGMLAGLSGMLYTANYATCSYMIGDAYEMTAIAICILGGVSIVGGKGKVDGVIIGFLMMSVITYFISLLPGLSVWSDAIQGAIIIAAVALNKFTERSAEKRALKERSALI